jgi:hypothetical protein
VHGSDQSNYNRGGNDEAATRDNQSGPATLQLSNEDRHFRGTGAGDQAGCRETVKEFGFGNPMSLPKELVFHHGDVSRRTTKYYRAKLQKDEGEFSQRYLTWRSVIG